MHDVNADKKSLTPYEAGALVGGPCDVGIGRMCWRHWYPAEKEWRCPHGRRDRC